jgi:hypothetical protein
MNVPIPHGHIGAIRTTYSGLRFRSRTEARWAAFFDELKWPWQYEPCDLRYYIPDFVILFDAGSVLCEVKGCNSLDELRAHTFAVSDSGWEADALLVGSGLLATDAVHPIIGLIGEPSGPNGWHEWSTARLFSCLSCGHRSVLSEDYSWRCRVCGTPSGHIGQPDGVLDAWAKATNRVQWRP